MCRCHLLLHINILLLLSLISCRSYGHPILRLLLSLLAYSIIRMDGKKLEYKGEEALKELEKLTSTVDEVQESILKEILTRNRETEYLNHFIKGSTNVSAFKRLVPVITYSSIQPYIQRIADGEDSSLLSAHPIVAMFRSSGTSGGEQKLTPSIAEDMDRITFAYNLIIAIMNQYVPGLDEGKAMYLYFAKAEKKTPSGLPVRPALTSFYKSNHFKCLSCDPFYNFTSPGQTILCTDNRQSMYCQLLAGLIHRTHVFRLGTVFASAFLRAINFLEQNWVHLCNDIRSGHLDPSITDPGCRSAMLNVLTSPDPVLADEIDAICSRKSWKGILCQLWPRAKYIEAIVTGSMAQYIPTLEFYSAGKLPLVCAMYGSSECCLGVNLKPLCDPADVAYTILPNLGYFEFMPLGNNGSLLADEEDEEVMRNKLVNLAHVRLACYYELVVTTFAGLCRYRIGDVLQVTGFHNKAPQFRFVCRRNVILSIDTDKTSEDDLHKSVTKAKKLLEPYEALLVEYSSCTDTSTIPGHYVLFWEIISHTSTMNVLTQLETHVLEDCCMVIEESLDYVYRRCRTLDRSVGPLEIRVVEPGTFESLMDLCINQGGSISQYKTPRCIKSSSALHDFLNSRVCASFFSPRDPTCIP